MLPKTSLETRDLRLVRAIVEGGGVTRASSLLNLSQSAVSHQLKDLEGRLGLELFARHGRQVRVTDAGQRLVELSREVLEPMARMERELLRDSRAPTQELRMSTQCQTAYFWLPRVFGAFVANHPEVRLRIQSEAQGDPILALGEGRLDLAFCVVLPKDKRFTVKPLFGDELVALLPAAHALGKKPFLVGADFAGETLILPEVARAVSEQVRQKLFPEGALLKQVLRMPVTEVIIELVKAEQGVTLLTREGAVRALSEKSLVAKRVTRRGIHRKWSAVYRKGSELKEPIESLISLIRLLG
jgi:LysR family transcriptional regulator, regulator for metE and metH